MPSSIVIRDRSKGILAALKKMTGEEVLVGIPETKTSRPSGEVTNAELGYIHEFGAPGANIPARPFLIPGVRKAKAAAAARLRTAALAALDGNADKAHRELVLAGIIAENSVKAVLTNGDFVPLQPGTVAARFRGRETASRRPSEERYMQLIRAGASPQAAQEAAGIRPLINTGALRRSITSVVRKVRK